MTMQRPWRPLASACAAAALLTRAACGGGQESADEVTRADVLAARTERGQAAQREAANQVYADRSAEAAAAAWVPQVTDTWQWQLTGKINTGYDVRVYDIDLFEAPDAVMDTLRGQGRAVVC